MGARANRQPQPSPKELPCRALCVWPIKPNQSSQRPAVAASPSDKARVDFPFQPQHVPAKKANVNFTIITILPPRFGSQSYLSLFDLWPSHLLQPSPVTAISVYPQPTSRRPESHRIDLSSPPFQALAFACRDLDQRDGSSCSVPHPEDSSTDFHDSWHIELTLLHGLSIQSGNVFAKSDPSDCPLRDQPLSTPITSWCKPQHQQPHRVEFPDQDSCRSGLPASEHHQGREGREVAATAQG